MNPEDSLFDAYERSDQKPSAYTEPKFSFWNRSGWAAASEVRNLLEGIYSCYPAEHRRHIRRRFRSRRDGEFHGALLELLLFAMLDPLTVKVNADTPDFEFERHGCTHLLEAKAFDEYGSSNSLEWQIFDTVERRLRSRSYFVSITTRGELSRTPPVFRLSTSSDSVSATEQRLRQYRPDRRRMPRHRCGVQGRRWRGRSC